MYFLSSERDHRALRTGGLLRQARQDLNPQPAVLETAALPIELLACIAGAGHRGQDRGYGVWRHHPPAPVSRFPFPYFNIDVMTPAPTVRPPSRMANRLPVSNAIGEINVTFMLMLSPGITISTPAGNSIAPVMSIVRM